MSGAMTVVASSPKRPFLVSQATPAGTMRILKLRSRRVPPMRDGTELVSPWSTQGCRRKSVPETC